MDTIHTIGRRKAAVARIYLQKGKGKINVNGKDFKSYFPVESMRFKLEQPFKLTDNISSYDVKVNVEGGGTTGVESMRFKLEQQAKLKLSALQLQELCVLLIMITELY